MSDDVYVDHLAHADFILDARRDTFPCSTCASPEPARIGHDASGALGCSDCLTFRRCALCQRWTDEEYGRFVHPVVGPRGERLAVCEPCFEKCDESVA